MNSKDFSVIRNEYISVSQKKWDTFCSASQNQNMTLHLDPNICEELRRVFAFSDFVSNVCIREPGIADDLVKTGDIARSYSQDESPKKLKSLVLGTSLIQDEENLCRLLRRIRQREMVRIAWRDLSGRADVLETMSDLSAFADACLECALSFLYDRQCESFGVPYSRKGEKQHLVVLGMGKLGARELNFSSDIDLIFAYPEAGDTDGAKPVCNEEFFTRLCRRLINVIGAKTSDGIVFRVDMNLRPFGENGPIVMHFDSMDDYYQREGREWERYAWIKARVVAGDKDSGKILLERLKPFVFRKYLDFGTFESIRDMKQRIAIEVQRREMKDNIKLGPGGIREIEFFGQIFQLIRGGVVPALQERQILKILRLLAEHRYIDSEVFEELSSAYMFLRNIEHRLQEYSDSQTHQLPSEPLGWNRLAAASGFEDPQLFESKLRHHMKIVHSHFNKLLELKDSKEKDDQNNMDALKAVWERLIKDQEAKKILKDAGFDAPDSVFQMLDQFHQELEVGKLGAEGRRCLDHLMPLLLKQTGIATHSTPALNRILKFLKAIWSRTPYIVLLLENPPALQHLVKISDSSSWILNLLSKHPILLDELLDPRTLYSPPEKPDLEKDIFRRLNMISADDLEDQMEQLRIFKQINVLRVAAADMTNMIPLMRVSDHLTDIAEVALAQTVDLSWKYLIKKHGEPVCYLDGDTCEKGFVVIAYGKLGGIELGYDSDLDLVFLHAGTDSETKGGTRPIDNPQFFGRLGQRVIHILSVPTPAGILYQPDMRLRPSGSSGMLVCHVDAFEEYQIHKAWTWENQALVRARAVIGDDCLCKRFEDIRKEVLIKSRNKKTLQTEIVDMRERLRKENLNHTKKFDLKQGYGGMVDIEFLVQYIVLLYAHAHPELLRWTDNVRLLRTSADTGIISDDTAYMLRKAYLTYRSVAHRLSLQDQPPEVPADVFLKLRRYVRKIWDIMTRD